MGDIVKVELCKKAVEVRRVCDKMMTVVDFEQDGLRLICGYARQSGRV